MDISPVTASSSVQNIFATSSSQRVFFSLITPVEISSTSVDISGLGKLLSAASILDRTIVSRVGTDSVNLNTVVAATQIFVDSFNGFLQSSSLTNLSGEYLGGLFIQTLDSQSSTVNGKSILARLSEVGINYQAPDSQTTTGEMTLNLSQLQSAYTADRTGTIALLSQATQAIGRFAASFTSVFVQMDLLSQLSTSSFSGAAANLSSPSDSLFSNNATTASTTDMFSSQAAASASTITTDTGSTASGSTATGSTGIGATATGSTTTGVTDTGSTATGATDIGSTVTGSAATGATDIGSTAAGTTDIGSTSTGSTATGTTATGTTDTGAITTGTTATGTTVSSVNAGISSTSGATNSTADALSASANGSKSATTPQSVVSILPEKAPISARAEAVPVVSSAALPTRAAVVPAASEAVVLSATTTNPPLETVPNPAVNTPIDASNPAVAAAIAAYHINDVGFDGEWPRNTGLPPPEVNYSEIQPVAQVHPVKLDLSV